MPLSNLNSEQKSAVEADNGHNLIIASAGTGKTSTIVGRIYYLIKYRGLKPEEILLLTFTNKAAQEMVNRVASVIGKDIASKIQAGTFHSVSYRYIKRHRSNLILKQEADIKTLFRTIYEKRDFHLMESETDPYSSKYLYEIYNFYQNVEVDLDFGEWIDKNKPEHQIYIDIYMNIVDEYEETKKELGFMNFNDLLLNMRELLPEYGHNFKEVLVDEYQDTNSLQGSLIDVMSIESLFCVGDYDQSIYAFNGANIEIIGSFKDRYPSAKVHTLSKNYRSTKAILNLANRVIEKNDRLYPKSLEVTKSNFGKQPQLLRFHNLDSQYQEIAKKIKESKFNRDEIAILFRNNSSADGVEANLRENGVASKRRSGRSIFESKEIKSLFDIYTLILNPKDMMAFIHIMEYARGVGVATAKELFDALKRLGNGNVFRGLQSPDRTISNPFENNVANTQLLLTNHFEELGTVSRFKHLNFPEQFLSNPILKHPKLSEDGAKLLFFLLKLRHNFSSVKSPKGAIESIYKSDFYNYIREQLIDSRSRLKSGEKSQERERDAIEGIYRRVKLILTLSISYKDHFRFLNAMILGSKDLTQGEGVNLLTVHASKGLEFKEVYIVDLMDGRFPNKRLASQAGEIEEERRLFYVAVTRAEEVLYLSYAKRDDIKKRDFEPSQFLEEAGLYNKGKVWNQKST